MRGIAAYVDIGAALYPVEQITGLFAQLVLHINFLCLIARKSQIQALQSTVLQRLLPFRLVQEVGRKMWVAEEEPVAPAGACHATFLHKSPERGNTRAGPDHDDIARAVSR